MTNIRQFYGIPMKSFHKTVFGFMLLPCWISSQVLNIEQERIQTDTTGWSGTTRIAFDLAKNQKQIYNLNGRAYVQFKSERNRVLLLGDYGLICMFHLLKVQHKTFSYSRRCP